MYSFILAQKPVTLLNTSLSLDVLDILLRDKEQLIDDECMIIHEGVGQALSSDVEENVLPLPLWDRIRQRTAV